MLEAQQPCELNYRLYDYDRDRRLHLDEELEALNPSSRGIWQPPAASGNGLRTMIAGDRFRVDRMTGNGGIGALAPPPA